ncbi:serine/threonine-protein kinase/endoribonuclease IRE1a [Tanacetum coccineum]
MHYIAKISVFSEKTKFPLISSSEDATGKSYLDLIGCVNFSDDMRADMLALGHIIFFILAGDKYINEELTKLEPKPSDDHLKPIYGDPEALHLLRRLIHEVPTSRPTALQVWNHPLLWDSRKKHEFICTVGDRLETEWKNKTELYESINNIGNVFYADWSKKVDVQLIHAVEAGSPVKYGSTEFGIMYYLIRFIRNLQRHKTRVSGVIDNMKKGKHNESIQHNKKKKKGNEVPKDVLEMFETGEFGDYFFTESLLTHWLSFVDHEIGFPTMAHHLKFKRATARFSLESLKRFKILDSASESSE